MFGKGLGRDRVERKEQGREEKGRGGVRDGVGWDLDGS